MSEQLTKTFIEKKGYQFLYNEHGRICYIHPGTGEMLMTMEDEIYKQMAEEGQHRRTVPNLWPSTLEDEPARSNNFKSITSVDDIRQMFPDGKTDQDNWIVFSTSGVHGTYTTLDTIERYHQNPKKFNEDENGGEHYHPTLTVLIIRPRLVSCLYGEVRVELQDIPYLRALVKDSLHTISKTQQGNI